MRILKLCKHSGMIKRQDNVGSGLDEEYFERSYKGCILHNEIFPTHLEVAGRKCPCENFQAKP